MNVSTIDVVTITNDTVSILVFFQFWSFFLDQFNAFVDKNIARMTRTVMLDSQQ